MDAVATPVLRNDQMGYEASLDLGVSAMEHGLTTAAIPYLERAVSCRGTRFALVKLAKAHRDLGQLDAARRRLEQARALPDGKDIYVLTTLAAVLCDLKEHGSAFPVVMEAQQLEPKAAATLSVLARCWREIALTLATKDHIDSAAVDEALAQAAQFAQEAREAQPEAMIDLKDRRRLRASEAWSVSLPPTDVVAPVEQEPGTVLGNSAETGDQPEAETIPAAVIEAPRQLAWLQLLRRLFRRRS